jgi:hypothetical protein
MTIAENIREKLEREPFEPFRVRVSSGDSYVVHDPALAVLMKSELFIAEPNSDHHVFVRLRHIAALETVSRASRNGRGRPPRRGR